MHPAIRRQIQKAIEEYTGLSLPGDRVEAIEDPRVAGTYAVRAHLHDHMAEFLIYADDVGNIRSNSVEEVEFLSWPPTSR